MARVYDWIVVGSGPGGAMAALELVKKGHSTLLIEAGPKVETNELRENEIQSYTRLYQDVASRLTLDRKMSILQGKNLGGGATVNWTTCFRTPEKLIDFWNSEFDLSINKRKLNSIFEAIEERLNIRPWDHLPNLNNHLLEKGLKKLGYSHGRTSRNVEECLNLGSCGLGCPAGKKQDMRLTYLKDAAKLGLHIRDNELVVKLIIKNRKAAGVILKNNNEKIHAKNVILAAGAINTPGILLNSEIQNPNIGKRTFLHPVVLSWSRFKEEVAPYYGAPQSVYSDHFLEAELKNSKGFKLEVPPVHPVILSGLAPGHGSDHQKLMKSLPHLQVIIALHRDGFHPDFPGGNVVLKGKRPVLDYPLGQAHEKTFKNSLIEMAKIQLAAGALEVGPLGMELIKSSQLEEVTRQIQTLTLDQMRITSAHVMGGAAMGRTSEESVVAMDGRVHKHDNLFVMDGSVFPTSLGVNPTVSVLAMSAYFIEKVLS